MYFLWWKDLIFSYLKDIEQSTGRLYDNYLNKGIVTELDETENNEFLYRLEDIIQTLEIMAFWDIEVEIV